VDKEGEKVRSKFVLESFCYSLFHFDEIEKPFKSPSGLASKYIYSRAS